ncbi:MAG: hypothetical protein IT236_11235 [Bacteroidia bacterium]|nr:hypothetical protein [Bacteroidia bacterium]
MFKLALYLYLDLNLVVLPANCLAQFSDSNLSGFPIEMLADFEKLKGFKEIEFSELYVRNGDTIIPKQLVRKYTYNDSGIVKRYEKHLFVNNYTLMPHYEERLNENFSTDSFCFSNSYHFKKPENGVKSRGSRTCRYWKSDSAGNDEFYYQNGELYSRKQNRSVFLTDTTLKVRLKEWQNEVLISQKDSILKIRKPVPVAKSNSVHKEYRRNNWAHMQFDHPIQRPFRYIVGKLGSYNYVHEQIYKFIYHGNDTLAYKVEHYELTYTERRGCSDPNPSFSYGDETPRAIMQLNNYVGRIPTLITYSDKSGLEKRTVWIKLKQ